MKVQCGHAIPGKPHIVYHQCPMFRHIGVLSLAISVVLVDTNFHHNINQDKSMYVRMYVYIYIYILYGYDMY